MDNSKQNKVIIEFLNHYSKINKNSYKIKSYPDKVERNKKACDVTAQIGEELFAIEHTSIDSYVNQRQDNSRFVKLFSNPLINNLKNILTKPGKYQIVIGANVIPTGIDYKLIVQKVIEWIKENCNKLEVGNPPKHFIRGYPDKIPFEVIFYVWPSKNIKIFPIRFTPEDLEKQRKKVIDQALDTRGKKVSKYRNKGHKTILILESNDISLANSAIIGQAFANVIKKISHKEKPDEVYLIETETYPYYFTCLKKDNSIYPESCQ